MEFHEPVGFGDLEVATPAVAVYSCSRCGESFPTAEALRKHRFEAHPARRPELRIRGHEVGTATLRLTRELTSADIDIANAAKATINGSGVPIEKVGRELARDAKGTKALVLENEGVQVCFTLSFEIATSYDIAGVERCFDHAAHRGRLDRRAIEDFIDQSRQYPTAIVYCDGICEYLYGVLAKERSLESALPFDAYREKFNRAAESLRDMCRPLASMIVGLVDFHFNHFASASQIAPMSRFAVASDRILKWLKSVRASDVMNDRSVPSSADAILTDRDTERILRWLLADPKLARQQVDEVEAAIQEDIPELDKAKLRILLAETYRDSGNDDLGLVHARELINSPAFGQWAEGFTKSRRQEKRDV